MTGVLEPTTAPARQKAEARGREIVSTIPDNVRLLDSRRVEAAPLADPGRRPALQVARAVLRPVGDRERIGVWLLSRIRAWMVVPVVDFALMVAPLAWRPPQLYSTLTMAALATLLLTDGGRYVARLHLSVLDELPSIVTRLLAAVAAVSAVILYLHQKEQVLVFLQTACQAVALVVVGRVVTTRLIALGRRSGITKHHTVLIGGGEVAAELARTLAEHREYGLELDGFVDDGEHPPVEAYLPRLGRLADLDMAVLETGADTLLVANGSVEEHVLMDAVRTDARAADDARLPCTGAAPDAAR